VGKELEGFHGLFQSTIPACFNYYIKQIYMDPLKSEGIIF